ncbi:dystonin [Enoplosus armatus]|uniref:dystonin n=1 Tax=Enoplosus armatus TaxID=215367 RepID=UPI0039929D7F
MMIAAAFLVLLRPYSIQCVLLLLLLLLGTIATILFFCCWHRRLRNGKHPIKSVLSGRSKSRVGLRTHHFRSEGFRHSPRHARRSIHARVTEEKPNLVEIPESEPDSSSSLRKRKVKKRVLPEFYQSVQVTPTRKPSSSSGNPSLHGSMSSSADFSDEDDYSVKSGSASPAPGDTLPWNLPRHERSKRKIQGGSVLDPAERAVLRIADERDRVQKKTFTKWINQHLMKVRKHINDLYEDLRDGHNLISLLEVLSGDTLPRERDFLKTLRLVSGTEACAVEQHGDTVDDDKGPRERGRMRFHRLQNVQIALDYLKRRQVKLVNIRNDDITDGNPKLTLGLIWTIILHFQISEIHVTGESEDMTAKERLLLWSKQITEGYVGVRCDNFTTSWRDGRLFNAIIHKYRPDMVDMSRVSAQTNRSNLEHAFCVAEQLGVARLLDPEDVDVQSPDEKSVITYVSTLYDAFPKVPDGIDGISPNDVDIKWVEYQNMIKYLSQWIKHNVAIMSDRSFPNNPVELKALYTQYLQFKEDEIPLKENEKTKIKNLYKMLEMWIEFGRIQLPPGHHPNDVEKEWGKLIVAMLEREKSLRPEVERLEMLQQIANRVQRDCVNGEDKLALARTALQSDAKRLESGIQFLNEAEIAGYLLECENILRQQVVDIQILLDGKFPFADQLVQRVSKLRDDLLSLRAECSSVYSKGRTLTTEQTKMMISGITQSLNSGFSQNINTSLTPTLTPALTPGGLGTPGSTFTSSLTPCLTPSLTPALTPGLQPASVQSYMGSGGGMDPGSLRHLKHMQIRKPLLKSSLADPNMTEEEVNMKFVQDLLNWVEDMQLQLDRSEWGSDLPSVEMHLDNHKSVHRAIEEFQMSLKDAKLSEIQMTIPLKISYSDKLNKLEKQYERLLSCSRERQSHLESLHDFVSQATQELIWLNEKEEEEVAFDWSDRNSNISKKRDYHADLMRELDEKEEVIKSVQDKAERLMLKNHPARLTIEAYRAAMQTQWSWILQLCSCVEQHLKENAVYFEFFSDAKESMDYLKSLQDAIQRKYSCDRTSSLHRLEDLIQESMDEKEQLLQYRSTVAGLVGRAKNIVQLRPRNPESHVRSSIPVKAICDYRQIEITIYKDDECVLANNSHRAKWKVINPSGNEAMVPSVCFTVPPPNKEAVDMATRTEQLYQNVLALWHHSHINMKSVVSWHYLMADIRAIRNWNVASIKTMLPGEHQQVLSNLQSHFDEFLEDSEESEVFTVADCTQLERDVAACKEYYQELLRSAEREEHEESVYNHYISEIRNFRMHLEAHEEHLIRQLRTPLERDDLEQSLQRITEHENKTAELNKLKEDLDVMKEKCELFLRQAAGSPSVPTLSSELTVLVQSMSQVYSMSSIYMDKLKTVSLVVRHSQSAEALVKAYESKLYEEDAMNSDVKSIETVISTLKQWRTEIDEKQEVFHDMEDELQKARVISDRMFKAHNERDFDLDWHKEKADQLSERWQNIHSQIDSRLRDLDGISKSLKHYRDSYSSLDEWVREMEAAQLKAQENKPEDSKALAELLNKQKVLVAEIEQKQNRIDECQKYSEQYSSAIKDYELQLMTFRAMVDSQHKSPLKKRRMQSSSDAIQQEFMDLRTRYTALVTLMTQYVKFASETLKRTEDEERSVDEEKREHGDKVSKLLHWMSNVKQSANNDGNALKDSNANTDASNKPQVSVEEMVTKKEQIAEALRATQLMLNKHSDKMTEEEREKAQEQLKALNQAYSELSQHCSDQTTSAEEGFKSSDAGLGTGPMSGLIDEISGVPLPEAQRVTSNLFQSEPHVCLDWDDAFKQDLIYKSTLNHLPELNETSKCIQSSHVSSVSLSDITAVREGVTCEDTIIKMIEVKEVDGGLEVSYTGDTLTLERAFQCGLIPASVYVKILQRQKTCQDMMNPSTAEDVSRLEPVQEVEPCGVNRLILKCLSRNKSLTSGRDIHTLRSCQDGLSDQETALGDVGNPKEGQNTTVEVPEDVMSGTGNLQNGDGLKVDAAVQCDLMSSSSTLTVLGNQQFMGLVLPPSEETVSTSFQYDQQTTTDEFISRLFSNREKIAAFYIPENSEVVDITSAIQNDLIDNYTADVLKSIEIPDVFPDVDHLNRKFSSWLMYKKLTVDGCYHAADSLKVDNIPTHTEAKQLFISYLMINSYIDPKSGQRVLILDRQLSKMLKIFLKDSGENEQDYAIHLLKAQMEEGGILGVTSGRRYDLEAALSKGLVDEMTVLKLLDLQSDEKGSVEGDEEGTMFILKQAVSDGSTSSNIALGIMEQQSLLRYGRTISISESLQCGLVKDDSVDSILNSDPEDSIYPEGNCPHSISDDHNLGLININEAENTQQPTERKVAVMVLDLTNEGVNNKETESENGDAEVDFESTGNVEKMSNYLHHSPPSAGGHESLMISPSSRSQVTAESIYHIDEWPLLAEDSDSQGVISQLTDTADVFRVVIENAAPTSQSGPSSMSDRTSGSSSDPESQTQYATSANHSKSDSPPFDNEFFIAGYDVQVGNQAVSESELDMSSSHRNVLSEERGMENDTSAVQSPLDSEPTPSRDYSSPRDLVESALISVPRGRSNYDNNITEDGSRVTLPQQATLHSESDFSVEPELRCSQNDQSMLVGETPQHSPVVPDEVTATDTINLKCLDVEDSEHYSLTTTRDSLEAALADKDLSSSPHSATEDIEFSTDSLSPDRQHGDICTITSDKEQISESRNAQTAETSDKQNADIGGNVPASEINSGQSETIIGGGLGSDEEKRLDVCASVHPQVVGDFLSDSCITSDVSSSAPVKTCVDDQGEMITKGTDVSDLRKAQTQDIDSTIAIVQNTPQPLDKGERDTPHGLIESSHPDLLMDVLKQNALSLNYKEKGNSELILQEEKVGEKTEQSDAPNIQLQLLQVLRTVSLSQDLSMLQEVMDTLSSALGGDSQEERQHILESIKEESSEGEDEGSAEDDLGQSAEGNQQPYPQSSANSDASKVEQVKNKLFSIQDYLECVGRLQDHADVLDDVRRDLLIQAPMGNSIEELQIQIEECQSLESQLSRLAGVLTADMEKAKQLLNSADEGIPIQIHQDLASTYLELEPNFTAVSQMCTERSHSLIQAMETGKDTESNLLKEARLKLEDVTFDIQCFISEHAQFLSPAQSSYLLKFLSTTQRAFRDQTERLVTQRSALEVLMDTRERENQEKSLLEKHKEFTEKLEEVCDNLTLTENHLIGHQQQAENAESVVDLQQYQQEHQALQKDVLTNASALNEVITSTKKFLEENRSKLTPDQITIIESKLEEAKSKAKLINQRAEDSRKDLEKVVTTAIKQESEKAAAVERLEESKNKIEGLLDWISNIGNENESGLDQTDHISKENGNLPEETSAKGLIGEDDDANGNALQTTENDFGSGKNDASLDLDKQYDRVKARHQEILSQQQDLIMATQSAQALLDKKAEVLSPEEKEKLQKNIQELKGRYEASLTQAEQQMKQVQCVQEELKKFQDDCAEFEGWLDQAEGEMEELGAPAGSLNILSDKLQRQKSFSEDVISHKGDLRFITISGQKVLDVAKACGVADPAAKNAPLHVDTSGTCLAVKDKLDSAASRYKTLHSQCNQLGNNLKDVVDKYKKYDDSSTGLLKWLNGSEEEARKQQSEAIAADPQTLQKQLEETKALQGQMTGHQTAVDTLRKTAESLVTSEGDLLSNPDEIQETVDDIVERYDNLSKSVSDRNEKLQITLTRSMSVQDGLDEMMGWMEGVEASVKEKGQIPLDSASIGDILSKEAALEQDIASRQSSISAMKAKVKKFVETADPSAAALLQSKMDALSQRFSDACDKHKQKVSQLEQLKEKVEQFDKVADKVQQFVVKRSQDLHETDGPGKTFNELSELMQNTKAEMAEHASDLEKLQTLSKELSEISPDGNKAQIQSKMDNLSNIFSTFKDTVKEKEEEVSSCQDQLGEFRSAASALTKWLEQANEKVPAVQSNSNEKSLEKDLQIVTGLLDEWTSNGPSVQDLNSKGSALCSLITFLTSPAKTKTPNKSELMVIQQNMSFVNEGYASLGETLKSRAAELSSSVQEIKEAQKETDNMMTWLKDMKKTAASWNNAATEKDSVKTQLEQQRAFEEGMKQKQEQLQKLREKLLNLIETNPNSPEEAKWKQMLAEIDAAWADISGSVEERKQHLEQSNKNLDIFQTTELQLGQWLSEKELMMSVLGPLSIDPNMLKMQKQQVQILQNEFKSRKPQYEQLEEAASAILSSSGDQDPSSGKLVREQLAAVTQKWQGLTGQLDQRDSLIDQAAVKTGQFQGLLRSISQSATQLENQLTNHQGQSTQPDAVKKQLEDVHNISTQLREERKKLKEAEAINAELTGMVTEDYLKADLARQLESVSKPFKQLEEKAAKRIEQLNSTFASSQQFHQTSKDFQSWLGEKLQDQSKPQLISAKVDVLQQTLEEHSKLQKALSEHGEAYNTITGKGEMLLQNTDGAEKLALQGQLTTLSSNWEEVKKSSVEQADKLQTALQRSLKYQEHAEKLSSWIQECEASEGRVKLTVDPVAVESSISQVKALQKDVDKHRGMVEQLNAAADSLLEVANMDTEAIKEEKASIGKRVDNVVEGLQNKRESLEKISHTVKEFNDAYKEAKGQLEGAKKQVDAYESQGVQAHSNKNLTNMKAQHKSLEGVQNQVEHLKNLAKDLVVDVPDADGVTDLLLQADSVEKDYSTLNKTLEETCQVLEGKLQGIGQFQTSIRDMFTCFTDLDDELDSMAPVDLDLATLKEQQDSIQSFVAKLQELMANTANAGDSCKKMIETETSPDLLGLKRDLDALSKQCGKLLDRAKGREVQVQSTLTKLEELYGKLHQAEDKLCKAVDKQASQEAVGMETDVINQQLEAFKAFQKEDIDPLQTQLQDINSLGQGLIQTAAKGTSTKKLDDDLEEVNTKWNTLNKKIAERSAQLHEALLHCGRFQDALESLLSWLTDTEELVANQKPPSAEFKVVKAQIQEQKLLQRLLDDRKPTVELIKKEGGKVAELAESVDKEKVAKEIECLGQRWDTLLKKAENRHKQLESILVVTQQFHETLEPLSEWLAATEKHLANSEPIGTETSKLEDQISQHKALEEEIMNHSKDLFQAVSLGQMLRSVSSVDDKEFVQSKLDATQASYIELQERCRRKAEMLQQALANAQLFGEDEVALMNWLSEVHARLGEVSVEDYKIDVLEKQLAEQRALQSDIELRKKNVDQAISNGMELLKQTTGDEVVVIQGKLDGIKTKYAEICSLSDNVLKTLERVLSLSSKLQHAHEDLSSWLDKVEAETSAFADQEPVGEQLLHAQSRQKALLKETKDQKPVMDKLNELSSSLLDLIPWHTREGLDKLVTEDNERYRGVCDTITQHVDQINADILKSQQFEQAADTELSWLTEAEGKLLSMGEIRLEQDQTTAQLQAQKIFSMDIMRHKDAVDDIVKTGKAIMNSKNPEEKEILKAKTQTLLEKYGIVSQLNSERCLQLERAQSLAGQFWETYEEMWPWLQETLSTFSQLPPPAIEYDTLRQQQEELRQMRELIAEHKPHIDKMNKTGPQLLELSPVEGVPIREKYTASDQLYTKLKADVKQRAATLDEAISKSTQFHDKIDPMLESLERIAERLRQPPSISVEVDKIKEQITENKAISVDLEKLQPSYETLRQRGEEMIARSEGADKDISAKAVQDKLDQMVFLWSDIQALLEEREAKLLDVMDLADKFWCDHCALIVTIKDSQDLLRELEEPGVDPSVVKQQQEFVEGFKEEIDGLQEELDVVQNQGAELMTACGEPDKPVIKKSIDEVNSAWENLNKTWKERVERLEEAMQAAVQFQDGLQGMFDWVDILESKLDSMSPVGTDLETVKQQIVELKEFKGEAYQLQIEMERLNHQAGLLLKKVTEEADRCAIKEPMSELKMLWDNLDEKIISRQHKLEGGLLALGQFQHALDELLAWMSHTEELLNEQRKAGGDPKAIEIELAKHHVLQNDVFAHKATVETVNKAGNDLVESSAGEEASSLQSKLEMLNQRWKAILEQTAQRKQQLESALLQAQGFHGEIEDMQQWLKDTERQLLASKAVGGLPDTAREQLNAHLELCSALEVKEELYQELMNKGHQLLAVTPEGPDSNTEQDLANLKDKWEAVQGKVAERKVKLEEALTLATDFHNSLQDFINWLTQAEQTLNMVSPASLILETIMFQIDEHKMFVTEVNSHRDHIIELDKTGTHLKYFSQKQDVVLIKNLLLSVQGRWEKLVQRSVERGRLLDDARKRAKQFHETWNKLMEWLDESEKTLDSEVEIANDPGKIKMQLTQHKEFQKALGSKHSVYDTTSRTGRALKDKTSLQDDNQKLDDMLSELRDKWDTVCGKSIERQNKLEEALLFSGQFTDALQALIDWLYRVEPQLAEDQPVHGDIDLVLNLIDNHKVFQKELGKRTVSVQALKRSARELIESSHDDSSWVKVQMQELSTRWETVCNLSVSKQARLEQALCQAEEFHSTVHILLEWLAEAEQSLRFHGSLPDDEEALQALIEQHKEFMKKLEEKRVALNKATSMGEAILTICHPDSITTIKHWNTIIKARFEEVQAWARQHQQRLATALTELLATQELLENLLTWLQWAETNLNDKDKEPLPQEIEEVKSLIAEHQAFMEEMTRKQPDVDKITKTHKRKAAMEPQIQSQIPVLGKGRAGRKRSPTQTMYASATQAPIETKNPRVNLLVTKWQHVWLLALDRRRKLNDAMDRLEELKEFANFDFDVWRKRYMRWMNHKKSRVMDFFRRIDKDQDGKVTRQEFIEGILSSKFPTSRLEMSAVADIFDRDGDGYIDYYEFVAALHPNKDAYKPLTDADKIEDEVTRQVAKCKCPKRFQVEQIGANKYRFYLGNQFGDSQQLRLVRILRSTVMVRVGGGWMALDEFLVKNDPCRAKGRTNMELREKFILPEGTTQVMASFRYRGRRSRPSSRGASPNRSTSSQSCAVPSHQAATSTQKTPQHITRNYDKPWLTNSKPSTPLKSSDSFESQGSSSEGTPVQGSKLRLPGYLSGKGFQSGEEGTLISAAVLKARTQTIESRKNSSRPGSKAGSRGSSRRGSDASDFDISDIQSVCSDVSETVGDSARATPRSASRQRGGKPSKIPTPQRRTTPTSKLAKGSKR